MLYFLLKEVWNGKSLTRAYMNAHLVRERFEGNILDVGGGRDTKYLSFHLQHASIVGLDVKTGTTVDFETDVLPIGNASCDTVLLYNVLEHLFDYSHILIDIRRVLRRGGTLHGFVPFLMKYHADPHDYFRYTDEALVRILARAGWENVAITAIGGGPFIAGLQQMLHSSPRFLRPPLFLLFYALDRAYLHFRPEALKSYPLGFYFKGTT